MEKVADRVSQLVKRNSKEKLTENVPDSPLPPFKPIPKIQLKRESSLPRIEVDRPATPVGALVSPSPLTLPSAKLPKNDYSLGQIIPPNAKKLRVRSFLWVKPTASSYIDTSIYYQLFPVLAVNIAAISSGLAIGFSAILLPQLRPEYNQTDHYTSEVYQPFLYIAEFYPSELRSVLAGLTTMLTNIMMALVVKSFTNLESLLGHYGVVFLYSGACFGAILLTLSYVPETKDKSLTVIHDKFARLKAARASPWVTPLPSPSVNSVRKFQYKTQMFTQ